MVVDRNSNVDFRTFAEQKKSPSFCLSWKMVESTVFKLQTMQTLQTVKTVQALQFSCLLFTNSDLHMIQVWVSFSYSFGNVGSVSIFSTPHDLILRGYFELMLLCNSLDEIAGSTLSSTWRWASHGKRCRSTRVGSI